MHDNSAQGSDGHELTSPHDWRAASRRDLPTRGRVTLWKIG